MKTLRISDEAHAKLTGLLGTLMAQAGKMQTYTDTIEALLNMSVNMPSDLLAQIESFVKENKQLGYVAREEFVRDAVRFRLRWLSGKDEYLEIPKDDYERLGKALKEMKSPYENARAFIKGKIDEALEEWKKKSPKSK